MTWQTFTRVFKLGLVNFWRNKWLSLAATLVMTLTLLIISTFVIMSVVISKTTESIRSKMDISVYFQDSASVDQIINIQRQLAARSDVKEVKYISKEEALVIFKEQQQGKKIAELIDPNENPLPRSLEIKAVQPENLDAIYEFVSQEESKPLIHNISYQDNKKVIDRLLNITAFIKKIGWISSSIFVLISILVILNTIRLTILTRKDEIDIMRLVGASDAFIRVPFIVEGFLYGVIATVIATIMIKLGVVILSPMTTQYLGVDMSNRLMRFYSGNFWIILGLELFVGVAIGIGCSLISIRKNLKV